RTVLQAALQLLAQEVRAAFARVVGREPSFPRLGYPAIAAESAGAVRGSEFKSMLRIIAGPPVAGRHRLLHQTLNKGACSRMTLQKARDRVGCSLAGGRVRKLRTQEREKLVRRTRGKPFDVERQDVGVLAIGQLEFH